MTFEQLQERHEALTQSLELTARDLDRLKERHEALTQSVELMSAENKERDKRLGQIMEGIARLLHVAEIHEHRLTDLEGGQ